MEVVVSEWDDEYHLSKKWFYTVCGMDFNPHHAEMIEREEALLADFKPCVECFERGEKG